MHYARTSLPVAVVIALVYWAYNMFSQDARVDAIDENVQEVKTDVRGLKRTSNKIKTGVRKVKEDTIQLKKGTQELQQEVQGFRKETKENFADVRTDTAVAKNQLLQELSEKEKNLTELIERAKDDMKEELEESLGVIRITLQMIAEKTQKAATKDQVEHLKGMLNAECELIENVRSELISCIKVSEARQKAHMKSSFDEAERKQEDRIKLLKMYIEKLEKASNGVRGLVKEGNKKVDLLEEKIDKIDREVGCIKGLLLKE